MVNECYLASHSWDTLFFKLQNFKETHLNSLVWVALHINFATLQLHHVLSERSNPWHMLKKRKGKKKKSNPNVWRSCLTSGSVLLSFFRTEVLSCSWIQNVDCPLELLLPSCMTIINPQTDWSLLLHFWIEVKLLSENLQKKEKEKRSQFSPEAQDRKGKPTTPFILFAKRYYTMRLISNFFQSNMLYSICREYIHKVQEDTFTYEHLNQPNKPFQLNTGIVFL